MRQALLSLVGTRGLEFEFTDEQKRNPDAQFERLLAELRRRALQATPSRVLLILDNVDKPELLEPAQIARLPQEDWLHVIATSRLGESELFGRQKDRSFLAVDELPEEDAVALIESHRPGGLFADETERAAAIEIVQLLGRFTLAVETAAVYLGRFPDDVTCAAFRDRLRKEGLAGLDQAAREATDGVLHGEKRVSATLRPTLERLGKKERLVLSYACLLPADHIALPWIRAVVAKEYPELGTDAEPGYPDPWQNLLRRIFSLRLLQPTGVVDAQGHVLVMRMHRLIQEYVRGDDELRNPWWEEELLDHIRVRAQFLWDGWLEHANRWELEPLVACAWQWLERPGIPAVHGTILASCVQGPLVWLGRYNEAESLIRRALEIEERERGPDDRSTLTFIGNLAHVLHLKGDYDAAEVLARRAVDGTKRVLGLNDPSTLSAVGVLAGVLWSRGDYPTAERLYRQVMESQEDILGPDHPNTLIAMNNLALVFEQQKRYDEAECLQRRALKIKERVFGPEHPETLTSLYNMACLLEDKGDYEAAEPLCRQALQARERVLSPEHPSTLNSVSLLANLLMTKGDCTEAESLYRRVLESQERVLGPEHKDTIESLSRLAGALRDRSDYKGAESLFRRVLESQQRVLGAEHPSTLATAQTLAHLLSINGDYAAAEPLFRRIVAVQEHLLGPEHHVLTTSLNNLALLLRKLGKLDEAEVLARRALAIDEKVHGPGHIQVAHKLMNLAIGLLMQGKLEQSERHLGRAWEIMAGSLDILSTCVLVIRLATGWLQIEGRSAIASGFSTEANDMPRQIGVLLGQLKYLLNRGPLGNKADFLRRWEIGYLVVHLRQKLPPAHVNLLDALVAVHNGCAAVASLDAFPAWRDQPAVPLDTPWPDEQAGNP